MAPGFYIQHCDTMLTQTCATDAGGYFGATTLSGWDLTDPTVTYANLRTWPDYNYYPPAKEETAKEKKIRQAAAFSMFYKSGGYTPKKSAKTIRAEQKERSERIIKFKSLNNNLLSK